MGASPNHRTEGVWTLSVWTLSGKKTRAAIRQRLPSSQPRKPPGGRLAASWWFRGCGGGSRWQMAALLFLPDRVQTDRAQTPSIPVIETGSYDPPRIS